MPKSYGTINLGKLFDKMEELADKINQMSEEERAKFLKDFDIKEELHKEKTKSDLTDSNKE